LSSLLSAALGDERAMTVIADALVTHGVEGELFDGEVAKQILTFISAQDGLVGITGRVALSRFEFGTHTSGKTSGRVATKDRRKLSLIVGLLTPTLGEERADTLVRETARAMKLEDSIDFDQALALLEQITHMTGVVAVAARFAKTRIHLSW
jgi:hypothetical protein